MALTKRDQARVEAAMLDLEWDESADLGPDELPEEPEDELDPEAATRIAAVLAKMLDLRWTAASDRLHRWQNELVAELVAEGSD
jgi:hypothetical protein